MKAYEYAIYPWGYKTHVEVREALDAFGKDGWHVVAFTGREFILERELEPHTLHVGDPA